MQQNYEMTVQGLKEHLRVNESFDLIARDIRVGNKKACLFFIDGMIKDDVMEKILEYFYGALPEQVKDVETFAQMGVPYVEVGLEDNQENITVGILSGILALVVEGFDQVVMVDARTYPVRSVEEPDKDRVLRGSRDGFVETLVANTALIRRRIRHPSLTMSIFSVGKRSKTDVVVCYMEDVVDKKLLKTIKDKIKNAKVDSLTMNQQSLVEAIHPYKWFNPFPKFKYCERPDTTASALLEGNIVLLVDNSPSAVILPTSIFDVVEEADDYYFPPFTGTYLRFSRYIVTFVTLILTPVWLLALQNPELVPQAFQFVLLKEEPNIPVFWQLIILELAIDGLRLASLNTPSTLSTSLSVIAGIVLSDFAVQSGWFSTEALLYMAFVAISNYTQPSDELGYALKFMRILLLILTVLWNLWGFAIGIVLIFLMLLFNKTISGKSYLYPLIPFHGKELWKRFFRSRLRKSE